MPTESQSQVPTAAAALSLVVYAKDREVLFRFYSELLDLSEVEVGNGFTLLCGPGVELSVVGIPEDIAAGIQISSPPVIREESPLKFSFLVGSISHAVQRVAKAGGSFKSLESAWSWRGMRHLDGNDPEGNVLQLRERLGDA